MRFKLMNRIIHQIILLTTILIILCSLYDLSTHDEWPISDIKIIEASEKQTATNTRMIDKLLNENEKVMLIYIHWFGGQRFWWVLLISHLVPNYVKLIFPKAKATTDRNLFALPLPSWFIAKVPVFLSNPEDEGGEIISAAAIQQIIRDEIQNGIPSTRIMLGGISQGAVLAILAGLTFELPLAGVIAHSSFLPLPGDFQNDYFVSNLPNKDLPILDCHGVFDTIIPLSTSIKSANIIKRFNPNYKLLLFLSGHHPNAQEILKMNNV
ncbi:acyl-protein thioesterase 1-like protein [Dinothrombium tinctorium]|uniref:palmitoyl-protein hydrolase n=1 Tax=Dinothrombium tinctorium TaxID=1965070 RepID=A0A3S3P9Z6_9ACAR|nr:acyl-protein thioesterase 1-like protein [Dinothrombium tinctorium]RWS04339.1 acyl-protein thioesterase 1-like protein [Dinothrombium tinctorium]